MALTTYFKADNTTLMNNAASWTASPAGPPPASLNSRARWQGPTITVARIAGIGAATTWGQIVIANPGGACSITGTSLLLTLNPSDSEAGGISIDMSAATQNFTIDTTIALAGVNHTWSFGSTGRTLTAGRVVSGTGFGLTLDGNGTWAHSSSTSTYGGTGKEFRLRNGAGLICGARQMGDVNTLVDVGYGCTIDMTTALPLQNAYRVSGPGNFNLTPTPPVRRSAAAFLDNGFNSPRVLTVYGPDVSLAAGNNTITAQITGTMDAGGTVEFVTSAGGTNQIFMTNTANDYVAPGGIIISSRNVINNTAQTGGYNVGNTDAAGGANDSAPFGNVNNAVTVSASGKLYSINAAGVTRTVSRAITFEGSASAAAIHISNSSISANSGTLKFVGPLTFSGVIGDVGVDSQTTSLVSFGGAISGSGGMRVIAGARVEFNAAAGSFSSWTGNLLPQGLTSVVIYTSGYASLTRTFIATTGATIQTTVSGGATLAHSAYTLGGTVTFSGSNPINTGAGAIAATNLLIDGTVNVTIPGNITSNAAAFNKDSTATLTLSGSNSGFTPFNWRGGSLNLNSAGSTGTGATAVTQTVAGTLDNTSGSPVTLTATGNWTWNVTSMTWGGTNDLTRNGNLFSSVLSARTMNFVSGRSATLKFTGTLLNVAAYTIDVGGSQTGTTSRLWIVGANLSVATAASSVTAGYYKIGDAAGLGAVGTTTPWNVSSGGCIELDGVTTPATKNGSFVGDGPTGTMHGVLRSTSTMTPSKWQGAIQFTNVAGGRITAANQTTLTLDDAGSPSYSTIVGTSGSPLVFVAGTNAVVNVNRVIANTNGAVTCGNGGTGRVVLARANQHTGKLTCQAGETILTNQSAAGTASTGVDVNAGATLAVEVASTYKAVLPGTTKLGSSTNPLAAPAVFRIGA